MTLAPGADATAGQVKGFWLVRPDGSRTPAWHLLHEFLRPNTQP